MNLKPIFYIFSITMIISSFSCKTCKKKDNNIATTIEENKLVVVSKITSQYSYPGVQGAPAINSYRIHLKLLAENIVFDSAYIFGYKAPLQVLNANLQFIKSYSIGDSLILQANFPDKPESLDPENPEVSDPREKSGKIKYTEYFGYTYHQKIGGILTQKYVTTTGFTKLEPIYMP